MGSLDFRGAKQQFLKLMDHISSSHLPTFAIWLDTKIAEYKVNGMIGEGSEDMEKRPYPEWISKSLRQNLSFILPEDSPSKTQKAVDTGRSSHTVVSNARSGNSTVPGLSHAAQSRDTGQRKEPDEDIIVKVELNTDADMSDDDDTEALEHPFPVDDSSVFPSQPPPSVLNADALQSTRVDQKLEMERQFSSQSSTAGSSASHQMSPSSGVPAVSAASDLSPHPFAAATSQAAPLAGRESVRRSKFKKPDGLEIFMDAQHRARKMFRCVTCLQVFHRSDVARIHVNRHRGEKPFSCSVCLKGFTQLSALYRHQRNVHGQKELK